MYCKIDQQNNFSIIVDVDAALQVPQFRDIAKSKYGMNGLYYLYLFCNPHPFGSIPEKDRDAIVTGIVNQYPPDEDNRTNISEFYRNQLFKNAQSIFGVIYPDVQADIYRSLLADFEKINKVKQEYIDDYNKQIQELEEEARKGELDEDRTERLQSLKGSFMDHISETLKVVSDVGKLIKNQEKDLEDKMVKQGKSLGRGTYIHKIRRD